MFPVGILRTPPSWASNTLPMPSLLLHRRERKGACWQQGSGSAVLVLEQAASGEHPPQLLLLWGGEGLCFLAEAALRKSSPQCLAGLIWEVGGLYVSQLVFRECRLVFCSLKCGSSSIRHHLGTS